MTPLEFLAAVLPPSGKYCAFSIQGGRRVAKFTTDQEELFNLVKRSTDAGHSAWFGLATFGEPDRRLAENAIEIRSLFMDLDCGLDVKDGKPRAFPSKREAIAQLISFSDTVGLTKLGSPTLVDSGGGVHVYWAFRHAVPIAQWKPMAEALKRAATAHAFPIDMTVTADAARVLAMPGTDNVKTAPRPVKIKQVGDVFDPTEVAAVLAPFFEKKVEKIAVAPLAVLAIPGPAPRGPSALAEQLAGNSVSRFKTIMLKTADGVGCGQLAHYVEHAADDGMEPVWRGILSWTKYCVDGEKAAVRISEMHPYEGDRMRRKLSEIKGPYACAAMDRLQHGICDKCKHFGKITNPLALGREYVVADEAAPQFVETHEELPPLQRPALPRGFDYATGGGIIYHKPAEKKAEFSTDILVTSYDLFLSRVFRTAAGEHINEFTAVKKEGTTTFAIAGADTTNDAKVISILANNNIYTVYGAGHDTYLARFVRACVAERSSMMSNIVNIPPRFGWQDNGNFAVGDMVYSKDGPEYDYNFKSTALSNLIQATQTKGDLDTWRRPWMMLRRKRAWGHLAIAMSGFGSVLQRFMPKGTNACAIHVCQETSSGGKTLSLNMQASIWGLPKSYFVVPRTSETTMMQRAGLLGGLPLIMDEITPIQRHTNGEWGPNFMYDFANGAHKIKGSHAGNAEIANELMWDAIASLTSNSPMLEFMVGARKTSSHGEVRRFLEWAMSSNYELEMTEEDMAEYSLIFENYGAAGRKFAKWCVTHQDEVQEICNTSLELWKRHSGATGRERFWSSTIATNIAACSICAKIGIIDIPISHILDFWMEIVSRMRTIIDGATVSAEDLLNRYIADNNGNFVRVEENAVLQHLGGFGKVRADSGKGAVRGRVEYNTTPGYVDIFIEEKLLKMFCAECNRSYANFVTELEALRILKKTRRDLLAGTGAGSLRVQCLHICRPITPDDRDKNAVAS